MSERALEAGLFAAAAALALLGYGLPARDRAAYEPSERAPGVLRVVTWNLGDGGGGTGSAFEDEAVERVAGTLNALEPDLVLLQEVPGERELERLVRRLDGAQVLSLIPARGARRVAVLARHGELELLDAPQPRRGRSLGFAYRRPGRSAIVGVVLHADAWSSRERNLEIGTAADWLATRDEGAALLLAGDLNLDLDPGGRRDLFTDDEHRDVQSYEVATRRLVDAAAERGPTAEPDRRLDYVLVERGAFELVDAGPWKGRRVGAMDHDPVVADLRYR